MVGGGGYTIHVCSASGLAVVGGWGGYRALPLKAPASLAASRRYLLQQSPVIVHSRYLGPHSHSSRAGGGESHTVQRKCA